MSYWTSVLGHFLIAGAYGSFGITQGLVYSLAGLVGNAFFAGAISGCVAVGLHRTHRDGILVTLGGASLVWSSVAVMGADFPRAAIHWFS